MMNEEGKVQEELNWKTNFQFAKVNTCSWKSLQE